MDDRSVATSELESGIVTVVPGKPEQSELLLRVSSHGDDRMPPEDAGEGLTDQQIALLRAWIEAGAHYQRPWAFSPLATNKPPRDATDWSDNPIDVFVESRLRRANLAPADEADRHTLVRRLYFDLCGLPPTPDQTQRFVEDGRPNAYAALVDELLASPAYGERWGRHWLDVARYGDSNGGDENHAYPLAHHYRDYVIQAFNEDLPYDRFLTQQLAGDLLQPTDDEGLNAQRLTATGYLAIGMKILAEQDPIKKQADMVDEQIDTLGRTFLGLSLGCARCHDHKFNPKPELQRNDGKPLPFGGSRVTFADRGELMRSPWKFRPCGESGLPMSELWQYLPQVADELCMIHSMCETNVAHGGACMKLHTGDEDQVRPSMGSWISYGLGTENQNLPSFITICPTSLHGSVNNFGSAFLPSVHQGVPYGTPGYPNTIAKTASFRYMSNHQWTREQQQMQLELLRELHESNSDYDDAEMEARIQSFELAFRMQMAAPETVDISQ